MAGKAKEFREPLSEQAARDNLWAFLREIRENKPKSYADYVALTGPEGLSLQYAASSLIAHTGVVAPYNSNVKVVESRTDGWKFKASSVTNPARSYEDVTLERQLRKWLRLRDRKLILMQNHKPDAVMIIDTGKSHDDTFHMYNCGPDLYADADDEILDAPHSYPGNPTLREMQAEGLETTPQALDSFVRTSWLLVGHLLRETEKY